MRILSKIKPNPAAAAGLRRSLPLFLLLSGSVMYCEVLMHIAMYHSVGWRILYPILFSIFFGGFFCLISGFFSPKANRNILLVTQAVLFLWFGAQLIYFKVFGSFISLFLVRMGGTAVTNFIRETLACIWHNLWYLLLLLLPLILTGVLLRKKKLCLEKRSGAVQLRVGILCCAIYLVGLLALPLGGTRTYSIYDLYYSVNTGTDASICNLGVLTTFRLELKYMISNADRTPLGELVIPERPSKEPGGKDPVVNTSPIVATVAENDHAWDINFSALAEEALKNGDTTLATLHTYFSTVEPTEKNQYTGMFKGKNLIMICAESFSPYLISEELTPTLYRLSNEGFRFNNYYGSYQSVTTNGEYTFCMGLFPDLSRSKRDGSFAASAENYVPFCMGNMFQDQLGIASRAYHGFKGSYYSRELSHPNMGYSLKTMGDGLTFTTEWPTSDLEMMQQSVGDYIGDEQFNTYYMSFSGHYQYDFDLNPMAARNQAAVENLPYSEKVQAFLACNLELEKALAYLMEQLEAAGVADDTVIVLTNDHYPYGLTEDEYNELAGTEIDTTFGKYKNSFICWSGDMEAPINIDTPCSTEDILPTLLNLFGFDYDSRLMMGRDVLDSNAQHVAILSNQSFITNTVMFDSTTSEITYLVDPSVVPDDYVDSIIQLVKNELTISTAILDTDYYRVLLKPETLPAETSARP